MSFQLKVAVFLMFIIVVTFAQDCKYLKFSPIHSYCLPPNPSCTLLDTTVTDEDKDLIVRLHNEYREKVATGKETAAGGLPTASNMMEMMDHHLAAIIVLCFTTVVTCKECYYKKFDPNHTGCKSRNPTCQIVDNQVTQDDKNLVVRMHNQYREKVAMGRETAAGGLPTASNMLEMVWDDELAYIAQRHAETCEFQHDCSECRRVDRFGVGQNLYMSWSSQKPSNKDQWEGMVKSFYNEVTNFKKDNISPFKFDSNYGHFSQVVWADSWRLGCGKVVFMDGNWYKTMISCNYGPAGNMIDGAMYKTGDPCSACPPNSCCGDSCNQFGIHANYSGLCKELN